MNRRIEWPLLICLAIAGTVYAGRPLTVDDAGPVDQGKSQLMTGVLYQTDTGFTRWDTPTTLGYGLMPNLEVGIGFGWQHIRENDAGDIEHHNGCDDLVLYTKWKFLSQEKFFLDQTIIPSIKIPIACHEDGLGSGKVDYSLTWIATRQWTESLATDVNVGYTWTGRTDDPDDSGSDILFYGTAVRYQMTKTLQPVAEIYALDPVHSTDHTWFIANAGVRWQISEQVTLDCAIGTGIGGDAPQLIATTGLTWNF